MTEAVNTTTMSKEEFEQRHTRTWDYVARVGKIWEEIAEEQQAIVDGKGYQHIRYDSHLAYWNGEFAEKTGWSFSAITAWMEARRIKLQTPERARPAYQPTGPDQWRRIRSLEPEERKEFLETYADDLKPKGSRYPLREAVKEFKGDRSPVVRDVLKPEDMADIPSGEFDRFEEWASRTSKLIGPIRRLGPSEVADAYERLYPEHMDSEIDWADQIANWYAKYRDELVSRKRAGIHAVN